MKKKKTYALECGECKSRNYKVVRSVDAARKDRVEIKKYCKFCKQHVIHKEVR